MFMCFIWKFAFSELLQAKGRPRSLPSLKCLNGKTSEGAFLSLQSPLACKNDRTCRLLFCSKEQLLFSVAMCHIIVSVR